MILRKYGRICALIPLFAFLAITLPLANAQDDDPQAVFDPYTCVYLPENDSVQIRATLLDADGTVPQEAEVAGVDVRVQTGTDQDLLPGAVTFEVLSDRLPLRMVLVLDITETAPVARVVQAVNTQLLQRLRPDDEIQLITFGGTISRVTPPTTDKETFFNTQLADLTPSSGDNAMYAAVRNAVLALPPSEERRQIVVLITDSTPRITEISVSDVIGEAVDAGVQIFTLGYYSRDIPDEAGLVALANGTDGYAYISRENATIEDIETGVNEQLRNLASALSSELVTTVSLRGVQADLNNRIALEMTVRLGSGVTLTETVTCRVDRVINTINFVGVSPQITVTGTIDIAVEIDSELPLSDRRVVFFLDDEIVQNENYERNPSAGVYVFQASAQQPGLHTIRAELRNRDNETLAETPNTIRIYAQQLIRLESREMENGGLRIEAYVDPNITLPNVYFFVARRDEPATTYPLSDLAIPFQAGRATLVLNNPREVLGGLPLDLSAETNLQVTALVPGLAGNPPLAVSNALRIELPEPPPLPTQTPLPAVVVPPAVRPIYNLGNVLLVCSIVFFSILNILLLRQIGRARVRRVIRNPDSHELGEQLMTVTVQAGGVRQSHRLTKKTITIGRGAANDINLGGDADISRQHGVIIWRRGEWWYTNRKPRARARVDGKWTRGYKLRRLEPITNIEIGGAHLVFHSSMQADVSEFITTNL